MTQQDHAQPTLDPQQVLRAKEEILRLRRLAWSAEHCAGQVGICRTTIYRWMDADPEFAAAWLEANESRLDWHEDVLRKCAAEGIFVPSLAVLKSAGRIIDRQAPAQVNISLYQVFQQILAPGLPELTTPPGQAIIEHQGEHQAIESTRSEPVPSQLEDGSTHPAAKGKPSAKPASRRHPGRQPLPR